MEFSNNVPRTKGFEVGLTPEKLKKEFLSRIDKEAIKEELRQKGLEEKNIESLLEKEDRFVQKVLEAIFNWCKEEKPPIIMWDLDYTVGIYSRNSEFVDNIEDARWAFRPLFIAFVSFLKEKNPGLSMGILTSREQEYLEKQLEDENHLAPFAPYIDARFIKSESDLRRFINFDGKYPEPRLPEDPMSETVLDLYEDICYEDSSSSITRLNKLTILGLLRAEGYNVKLIDDTPDIDYRSNLVALQGDNVLRVTDERPAELSQLFA